MISNQNNNKIRIKSKKNKEKSKKKKKKNLKNFRIHLRSLLQMKSRRPGTFQPGTNEC